MERFLTGLRLSYVLQKDLLSLVISLPEEHASIINVMTAFSDIRAAFVHPIC